MSARGAAVVGVSVWVLTMGGVGETAGSKAPSSGEARVQAALQRRPLVPPSIRGGKDGNRGWMVASHRGLLLQKVVQVGNHRAESIALEIRFGGDAISVRVNAAGVATVVRGGRRVAVASPEALTQLQALLAGSEAVAAVRLFLAERETVSELKPSEMSLLSAASFVAALAGDVDAPRRLVARFAARHRGPLRPVWLRSCWMDYSDEVGSSWNDMQDCVSEAGDADGAFTRAYRRGACNAVWLLRSESAWFEYAHCMGGNLL